MKYWHIQMNQPWGRGEKKIDSTLMLKENIPIIGTGEWDNYQCRNFKDEGAKGLKEQDIILVREGENPVALCKVTGSYFSDKTLENKYHHNWYRTVEILSWYTEKKVFPQPQSTLQRLNNSNTDSWKFINTYYKKTIQNNKMTGIKNLIEYKKQIILQGPPGTGKAKTAKDIAVEILGLGNVKDLNNKEHFELIQFHPSYTYEDFVRGIVSLPNEDGEGVLFKTENKLLAKFAEKALKNKLDIQKGATELSKEKWINEQFEKFIDFVADEIEKNGKVALTEAVFIVGLDTDAFRYNGVNEWTVKGTRMLFKDIKQAYLDNNIFRKDIKHNKNLSGSANWDATYFIRTLELFRKFLTDENLTLEVNTNENEELKNYVLIIDEINRANLPSVLGELIYALEYRDEPVKSMYEYEGKREILLPSNLYIIGTMNTADRSVGHIDYAIKRRFAFVDVLPKNLKAELGNDFDISLFEEVTKLFIKNYYPSADYNNKKIIEKSEYLNSDFDPKDVWLGHSYFIKQYEKDENGENIIDKPYDFKMRLDYEIKPILLEYIKDGILKESARSVINDLGKNVIHA